jgi:hypothetical protein
LGTQRNSAEALLDEVVCGGVAIDVFHADQAHCLLEELDGFVQAVNATGIGKVFLANLQLILERHLYLSLMRVYEPYSSQNPSRSIPAAIHLISSRAAELRIVERKPLIDFLSGLSKPRPDLSLLPDEQLSLTLAAHLDALVPKADHNSGRPLDQALANVKRVRDKALAHHDRIDPASLLVPGWPKVVELIEIARRFVVLVAEGYLNVHHDLAGDASRSATSLRRLLGRTGLAPGSAPAGNDAT